MKDKTILLAAGIAFIGLLIHANSADRNTERILEWQAIQDLEKHNQKLRERR